jgi:hypothetical protein
MSKGWKFGKQFPFLQLITNKDQHFIYKLASKLLQSMRQFTLLPICFLLLTGAVYGQQQTAAAVNLITDVVVTFKTPTNKLSNSIDFYTRLGFGQQADNPLTYFDGKVAIEIDTLKSARAGFNFYKRSWTAEIDSLKKSFNVITTKRGHMVCDPSGIWIYLVSSERMLPTPADKSYSLLGNYQGATIESGNIMAAYALYTTLGLRKVKGAPEQGFVELTNGKGFTMVLMRPGMCPHLFFNPSISYFNGKQNQEIIKNIKAKGIATTQDITWFNKEGEVDNIILRDPGGLGFFIFSD